MDEIDRRRDPRTDPAYSLANLLRLRAERFACALAALGTEDGLVMAASHPGRTAEEAVARASLDLRAGGAGSRALHRRRVDVDGQAVVLAVVGRAPEEGALSELADRVKAILRERLVGAALTPRADGHARAAC
ncbi:MAG: hypothetical protein M9894_32610 [Planctomycetes bacterium]|nr:hypothetical protein [Planctomycetota bacterium]